MLAFTLIAEFNTPRAIICDAVPNPGQRSILFGLIPGQSFDSPDLAARWEVPAVLCTREWHAEQLKRAPMLRPTGHRLAFLASLFFALCHLLILAGCQTASLPVAPARPSPPPLPVISQQLAAPPVQYLGAPETITRAVVVPSAIGNLQSAIVPAPIRTNELPKWRYPSTINPSNYWWTLEVTTNLRTWSIVTTNAGPGPYTVTNDLRPGRKFYRLRGIAP